MMDLCVNPAQNQYLSYLLWGGMAGSKARY